MKTNKLRALETAPVWSKDPSGSSPDVHMAFRGSFTLEKKSHIEIRISGASWYSAWLDGAFLSEGPPRFNPAFPEYDTLSAKLGKGHHLLAVQVHNSGFATRLMEKLEPFLLVELRAGTEVIPMAWRCLRLPGYKGQLRRLSNCLGWIESADTRLWPVPDWRFPGSDDASWEGPVDVNPLPPDHAPWTPVSGAETSYPLHECREIARGFLAETYGYEDDDPPTRFFLRDLSPSDLPAQGRWYRFDLGRVRLMHPLFKMDLPAGATVEFGYSEALHKGRVAPWITLSGHSCSLDRFIARGGAQEFSTLEPRGGRFIEVHIKAAPDKIEIISASCRERCHYMEPAGSFSCGNVLLEKIWRIGVDTLRACAEDTMVDTPVRERGAWMGDSLSVGLEIAAAAYGDLGIFRRMLRLAARGARKDGLVAGMAGGNTAYLPTFSAQWASAAVRYLELTGEISLLEELYPAAKRNADALEAGCGPEGLSNSLGWAFIDWGYVPNSGSDMAFNLHYLASLQAMSRWASCLGDHEGVRLFRARYLKMSGLVRSWLSLNSRDGHIDVSAVGYHRVILAMRAGLLGTADSRLAISGIKSHILSCFPNDKNAPRLSDPAVSETRIITPYFMNFALPVLIENGEMDFVLKQYARCWGWAIGGGRTTWLEVFDRRWSHSHHWSGCPTWQLSRYALGLWSRFDIGPNVFHVKLIPGRLTSAKGTIPINNSGMTIKVEWERKKEGAIKYRLNSDAEITLIFENEPNPESMRTTFRGSFEHTVQKG